VPNRSVADSNTVAWLQRGDQPREISSTTELSNPLLERIVTIARCPPFVILTAATHRRLSSKILPGKIFELKKIYPLDAAQTNSAPRSSSLNVNSA
jgi:hypothetical protein